MMLRVLVGGGVAGLDALLALRDLAGDRVALTLLSPEEEFVYRPMAVVEPFGRGHADRHPLADIASVVEAELVRAALAEVDPDGHIAVTSTGRRLSYDALLVAVGAASEPAFDRALTWTSEADAELFGGCCVISTRAASSGWRSSCRPGWRGRCPTTRSWR